MIHYVTPREPVGLTFCGGNIFVGEVPQSDRVTIDRSRVTCLACKCLLDDGTKAARDDSTAAPKTRANPHD